MLTVRLHGDQGRSPRSRGRQEAVKESLKAFGALWRRGPVAGKGRSGEKRRASEQRGNSRAAAKDSRDHDENLLGHEKTLAVYLN